MTEIMITQEVANLAESALSGMSNYEAARVAGLSYGIEADTFLTRMRAGVGEALRFWLQEHDGETLSDDWTASSAIADDLAGEAITDGLIPVYTSEIWSTFVALSLYNEEVDEGVAGKTMTDAALYAIDTAATRMVYEFVQWTVETLVAELPEYIEDEDE